MSTWWYIYVPYIQVTHKTQLVTIPDEPIGISNAASRLTRSHYSNYFHISGRVVQGAGCMVWFVCVNGAGGDFLK